MTLLVPIIKIVLLSLHHRKKSTGSESCPNNARFLQYYISDVEKLWANERNRQKRYIMID